MADAEISSNYTEDYGGGLLNNALRIYHFSGEKPLHRRSTAEKRGQVNPQVKPPLM